MARAQSSSVMGAVDQRTQMAGQNRMELLLFTLGSRNQPFGINVFKVREVITCPKLSDIPHAGSNVLGIASIRGETLPVIDLASAAGIGGGFASRGIDSDNPPLLIVAEFNMRVQAFVVNAVDRIVNKSWEDIAPPPANMPHGHYLTATTEVNDDIVGILDVERVLAELDPDMNKPLSESLVAKGNEWRAANKECHKVLVVDDSSVARRQLEKCLADMQMEVEMFNDGEQAYRHLMELLDTKQDASSIYRAIISDIEMPRMDGYTFISKLKEHRELASIKTVLHSSLSGGFNKALVEKVGADGFIEKFDPNRLAESVFNLLD